jgi:hypothetical protein
MPHTPQPPRRSISTLAPAPSKAPTIASHRVGRIRAGARHPSQQVTHAVAVAAVVAHMSRNLCSAAGVMGQDRPHLGRRHDQGDP